MTELIDRDALKGTISNIKLRVKNPEMMSGLVEMKAATLREVEAAPTIEAEPVRHGRWETWGYVFHGIEWKRCSCCGKCADVSYYGLLDGEIKMSTPAICGCCGARMNATDTNVGGKGGDDSAGD